MRDCTRTLQVAGYPGMITSGPHHLLCPITNYNVGCHPTSLQPHWTAVAQRFQVHFATVTRHTLAPSTARESNPTTVSHLQRRRMHPAYIRCLLCPFNHRIAAPCRFLIRRYGMLWYVMVCYGTERQRRSIAVRRRFPFGSRAPERPGWGSVS